MLDSRFPFLVPLDHSRLSVRLRRDGHDIAKRTGTRCVYNRLRRSLFFYYGDPGSGVLSIPAFAGSGIEAHLDVDGAVKYIQLGKAPRAVKDAIAARWDQEDKHAKKEAFDRQFEDSRPDAEDYADFIHDKRCGSRKLIGLPA